MEHTELIENLNDHAARLSTIRHCCNLFFYCAESEIYKESIVEVCNFGVILSEYINKTKEDFSLFQKRIEFNKDFLN